MLAVAFYNNGCVEATGEPNLFLDDDVFLNMIGDESGFLRKSIINLFGEGIVIGRLGRYERDKNIFVEKSTDAGFDLPESKVARGWYGADL